MVKYKDKPLEFWDTHTLTFLRELVSNPPTFACVVSEQPRYLSALWTHTERESSSSPCAPFIFVDDCPVLSLSTDGLVHLVFCLFMNAVLSLL